MKLYSIKAALLLFVLTGVSTLLHAQQGVVIGSNSASTAPAPDPNAVLWLIGDGKQGLIVPLVTNTTAVSTPAKGMVVYNSADNTLYYYNGTWAVVGSGSGGTATLLKISGNTVSIDPTGTATIPLSTTPPTVPGQILMWDGTGWTSSSITAPTAGQYLKWNAATAKWEPGTLTGAGDMLKSTYDTNANGTVDNSEKIGGLTWPANASGSLQNNGSGTLTWSPLSIAGIGASGDLTGTYPGPTIANNAVTTGKILDGTISAVDLAPNINIGTTGNINGANITSAGSFSGNGSGISNLNAGNVSTGTLAVARGGTGLTTAPTAGQLMIGNGAGYTQSTITSGTGITVANGAGSISVGTSGNFGAQNLTTTGSLTSGSTTTGTLSATSATVSGDAAVTGYTQLGSSSPGIQILELTGTTSAVADGSVVIGIPINQARIVFTNVFVLDGVGNLIPPMYLRTANPGYSYIYYYNGFNMYIINCDVAPFSSFNVQNRAIRITIGYKP